MHYYFTWGEFGLAMTAALLIYYLIVAACCYRQELSHLFQNRSMPSLSPGGAGAGPDRMGAAKEDDAEMNLVKSQDLDFAGPGEIAGARGRNKILLLGGLADFMQELKTLVRITIEGEDTRENFLSLFAMVARKYARLLDGSFNESIISYVLDSNLPFELSAGDIEQVLTDINIYEE